jgi:hypothetical protein
MINMFLQQRLKHVTIDELLEMVFSVQSGYIMRTNGKS